MRDKYSILGEILQQVKNKLSDYTVSIETSESKWSEYQIRISDESSDFSYAYHISKYNNSLLDDELVNIYIENEVKDAIKYHKKKQKFLYHFTNKTFSTQFSPEVLKRIIKLSKKVYKGIYDGIEIENSVYGTEQFDLYIVKLARTKSILRSKSEPIVYISLYEFFNVNLFDKIFGLEMDDPDVDPNLANEWTDINAQIIKIVNI